MWLESRWKVEVHVGVTGIAGAEKSTFINAIQGLCDDDYGAAPFDIVDCAKAPTCYNYPADPNIKFWELPGIENPYFTDLETYRYKVQLDKYDTFLIFSCHRVTKSGRELVIEIRKNGKSFFFIRTKVDEVIRAEKRKRSFSEAAVLEKIQCDCLVNLGGESICREEDIFLISSHHPDKWDFNRLAQAIQDEVQRYQRETIAFSR